MEMPTVLLEQWIKIGNIDGLVFSVEEARLQVGYFQNNNKAIKEPVVWDGNRWQFEYDGPNGSYLRGEDEQRVKRGPRG